MSDQGGPHKSSPRKVPRAGDLEWQDDAACKGTDPEQWDTSRMWQPGHMSTKEIRATLRAAKDLCAVCPVHVQCLDYAVQFNEYGIWAGTTGRQRRLIRVERNKAGKNAQGEGAANAA